jgi:hypothetical protein
MKTQLNDSNYYQPQPQSFTQQSVGYQLPYQPTAQNYPTYFPSKQAGSALDDNQHQQAKTIPSTYAFQYSSNQPYPSNPSNQQTQYSVQNSQIPQNPKYFSPAPMQSDVEKTLEKIDEQLQLSRRMYP